MGLDSDVRWLMSLSVMRSPPKTTSVATLRRPSATRFRCAEPLTAANASSWIGRGGAVASARVTALVGRLRRAHDSSKTGLGMEIAPSKRTWDAVPCEPSKTTASNDGTQLAVRRRCCVQLK